MRFRLTPGQQAFREGVVAFLDETLTPEFWAYHHEHEAPGWSPHFSSAAGSRGLLGVNWPDESGAYQAGTVEAHILAEELAYAAAPQEHHRNAVDLVGPALRTWGTAEQRQRFLPGIQRGEMSFAFGLAEPGSGSDLSSIAVRAVRDGDEYVLNGEKKYVTGSQHADYLWTLVRTHRLAPRERGMAVMLVPLASPGIDVQPVPDPLGRCTFSKVFLTDVRVPVENVLGPADRGWFINAHAVGTDGMRETGTLGGLVGELRRELDRVSGATRAHTARSPAVRQRLADLWITAEVIRLLAYRVAVVGSPASAASPDAPVVRLLASETQRDLAGFAVAVAGLAALTIDGWAEDGPGGRYVSAASATVALGTSELRRISIATRGLGLPGS